MELKYKLLGIESSMEIEHLQKTRDSSPEELHQHYNAIIVHKMKAAVVRAIKWRTESIVKFRMEVDRLQKGEIKNYEEE